MDAIYEIRKLVLDEQFEITAHARERMAERGVSTEGYILGYAFHVVAAKGRNLVKIVTVHRADEEKWLNHRTRKT
jgi:hypothetical protein